MAALVQRRQGPARLAPQPLTVARDGWGDARSGGWNAGDHTVGRTKRFAIDGLTGGNDDPSRDAATDESAAHRAIVVVPPTVDWTHPVEVLLHFHGYNLGDREHTKDSHGSPAATVGDVDADEIEQQLESSERSMVAILPQGTTGSGFAIRAPEAYVDEVLSRVPSHLPPKTFARGASPQRGRVVVSGHSGGGPATVKAASALQAPTHPNEAQWLAAAPLFLFDSINGTGELANVKNLLTKWLAQDLEILAAAGPRAPALLDQRGIRFSSTWTGGVYEAVHVGGTWMWHKKEQNVTKRESLVGFLDHWFADASHKRALGALAPKLRAQYRTVHVGGSHDFTVGTGHRAKAGDFGTGVSPPVADSPGAPTYARGTGHLEQALGGLPHAAQGTGGGSSSGSTPASGGGGTAPQPATPAPVARSPQAGGIVARQPHPAPPVQAQPPQQAPAAPQTQQSTDRHRRRRPTGSRRPTSTSRSATRSRSSSKQTRP